MAGQFRLVTRSGPTQGKTFELQQDDLTIGRDISNAIVINDAEVSRRHSRLRAQAGSYVIEDLGSTNGTFVNGQRLMGPHMLRSGEVIMLGEHIGFVFEATVDPNATVASSPAQETYRIPQTPQTVVAPPPVEYQPPYQQPPPYQQQQPYQPAYSGNVPQGPPEPYVDQSMQPVYAPPMEAVEPPRQRNMLLIGCITLLVLVCVCVVGLVAFDFLDLYCTGPFASMMEAFGFVCP